jgi:hypothetical protein
LRTSALLAWLLGWLWEKDHRDPCGLFWQIDDRDGMEHSIGALSRAMSPRTRVEIGAGAL